MNVMGQWNVFPLCQKVWRHAHNKAAQLVSTQTFVSVIDDKMSQVNFFWTYLKTAVTFDLFN